LPAPGVRCNKGDVPTLTDAELVGQPPAQTDLAHLALVLTDPDVGRTLGGPRTHAQVVEIFAHWRDTWAKRELGPFLFRADDAFVGYAGVMPAPIGEVDDLELLYASLPANWGRGLVTRMSRLVVGWAFAQLGVARLVAYTLTTNCASIAVMRKLGFEYQSDVEKANLPHAFYRLTREQWKTGAAG
jgi:RimJ/RimL family protein N-acetyltransferase